MNRYNPLVHGSRASWAVQPHHHKKVVKGAVKLVKGGVKWVGKTIGKVVSIPVGWWVTEEQRELGQRGICVCNLMVKCKSSKFAFSVRFRVDALGNYRCMVFTRR